MSENQAGQRSYASGYPLDPRLDGWPHNQFPSIQSGRPCVCDHGQSQRLPPSSSYHMDHLPKQRSLDNVYSSEAGAYVSGDLFSYL